MADVRERFSNAVRYRDVYEVYTHRGEIIVRKGDIQYNGVFLPEGLNTWHCGFHSAPGFPKPLTLYGRKVWCMTKEDIPKAIEILTNRISEYNKEVQERSEKNAQQYTKVVWK